MFFKKLAFFLFFYFYVNTGFCSSRVFLTFIQGKETIEELKNITYIVLKETKKMSSFKVEILTSNEFIFDPPENFNLSNNYEIGESTISDWVIGGEIFKTKRKNRNRKLVLSLYNVRKRIISKQIEINYKSIKRLKEVIREKFTSFTCSIAGKKCIKEKLLRRIYEVRKSESSTKKEVVSTKKAIHEDTKKETFNVRKPNVKKYFHNKENHAFVVLFLICFIYIIRQRIVFKQKNEKLSKENEKLKLLLFNVLEDKIEKNLISSYDYV